MGTTSLTREQVNEAIEQFADKIMEALGATVTDEAAGEPELTGTQFKAINTNGVECVMDAESINWGALVRAGVCEYFRCYGVGDGRHPWVRYSGTLYTNEQFAARMRALDNIPHIIHEG